jgi:hypothetical protein
MPAFLATWEDLVFLQPLLRCAPIWGQTWSQRWYGGHVSTHVPDYSRLKDACVKEKIFWKPRNPTPISLAQAGAVQSARAVLSEKVITTLRTGTEGASESASVEHWRFAQVQNLTRSAHPPRQQRACHAAPASAQLSTHPPPSSIGSCLDVVKFTSIHMMCRNKLK